MSEAPSAAPPVETPEAIARPPAAVFAAKLAVTAGLMAFILSKIDFGAFAAGVRGVDSAWLAAAAGCQLTGHFLNAGRTRFLLGKLGVAIGYGRMLAVNFVGVFFNAFLPGSVGGDVMRFVDLAPLGPSRAATLATLLIERFLGLLSLLPVSALALLLTWKTVAFHPLILPSLASGLALFAAVIFLSDKDRAARVGGWTAPLGRLFGRLRVAERIGRLYDAVALYKGRPRAISGTLAFSLCSRVVWTLAAYCVGRGVGVGLSWEQYFLIVPLIELIRMIPLTQGGLGLREGAFILYMAPYGVPREEALAVSLLAYAIFLLNASLGGAIFVLRRGAAR